MALKDPFQFEQDIPRRYFYNLPKPLQHPNDPNKIIICDDYDEDDSGIYELDLVTNKLTQIHAYDGSKFRPEDHKIFITESKTLFIIINRNEPFASFNLDTKQMNYDNSNILKGFENAIICYIGINNELHVIDRDHNDNHVHNILKFGDDNELKMISTTKDDKYYGEKLLYVPSQQKLIMSDMWEYDLNGSQHWYQNQQNIKMVQKHRDQLDLDFILAFENIVIIFYLEKRGSIYFYHLLTNKTYKCKYKVPEKISSEGDLGIYDIYTYKDGYDNAHILKFSSGKHVKVDLYKLIPNDLIVSHREYYKPLIMGYLRYQENQNDIQCIPFVLKTIILNFYPL